jgi:chaperonin GroEL
VENLAVKIMKEAADRTATLAGDGTTTAIVLAEAIINIGNKYITDKHNRTEVLRELVSAKDYVVEMLAKDSLSITDKTLKDVAIVSANNDTEVGELITETYLEVGKDGLVTVEKAQGAETYYETTKGLQVDRGYMSNMFVNNHKNDECILEDVHILVSDSEISSIMQIDGVLKPLVADRHNIKLLIIAPCSKEMENTLTANVVKNGLKICSIPPPNFGYKQHELMSDIAVSVGATYFSEKTGDDLSLIEFSDLGKAKKVIVGRSKTVIINNDDEDLVYKRDLRVL